VIEERMKSEVSKRIKDPSLIDDERMKKEVMACIDKDDNYSPFVEKIRRLIPLPHFYLRLPTRNQIDRIGAREPAATKTTRYQYAVYE
jgi:hypothetical protein